MEKWTQQNSTHREFKVSSKWVRNSLNQDHLEQRKLNRMSPLFMGDLVIQGNGIDGISAFERSTGTRKWFLPITNGVEVGIVGINDLLFVSGSDGFFHSIDLKTGLKIWSFPTRIENLSKPLLFDGVVYFLSGNNVMYALDAATGKQLWLYSRIEASQFSIRGGAEPVIDQGILYAGFSDGALVALNSKNGSVIWEKVLNRNKRFKDIDSRIVLDNGQIYVSGFDDHLYCLDMKSAEVKWKFPAGGYLPVSILGTDLIYSTTEAEILNINKTTGALNWRRKVDQGIATQVVPYKGLLVYGESNGRLIFMNSDGKEVVQTFDPGRGIFSTPAIDEKNNQIAFVSNEGNTYLMNAEWGVRRGFNWIQ